MKQPTPIHFVDTYNTISFSINRFSYSQLKLKSKLGSNPQAVLEYGKESLTWFEFNFRRVLSFDSSHSNTLSEGFLEDKKDCYDWHSCKSSPCHDQTIVGCHLGLHSRNPE